MENNQITMNACTFLRKNVLRASQCEVDFLFREEEEREIKVYSIIGAH